MSIKEREFAATSYSDSLLENGQRMADNSARLTVVAYQKRWATFLNQQKDKNGIREKLISVVDNIKNKGDANQLGRSTIRLYKATACYGLTMCYLAKYRPNENSYKKLKEMANFKPEKGLTFDNSLDKEFFEGLYKDIRTYTPPLDDSSGSVTMGKTSSVKAKTFSKEIYDIILDSPEYSSNNYHLLKKFIELNSIIGLRPIEWFKVKGMSKREFDANASRWFDKMSKDDELVVRNKRNVLSDTDINVGLSDIQSSDSVILVENGKNSLGRAGIKYRVLYSKDPTLYKQVNEVKKEFLSVAQKVAVTAKEGGDSSLMDTTGMANVVGFQRVMKMTQNQLYYITSKDEDVKKSLERTHKRLISKKKFDLGADSAEFKDFSQQPMKIPTIYSTRHQAVANAKKAGLNPVVIAAMFGHSSIVTASRHYGKSQNGRGGTTKVRPSQENIDSVILGMTDDQVQNIKEMKLWHKNTAEVQRENSKGNDNNNNGFSM